MRKRRFFKKTMAFVLAAILSLNISSLAFAAGDDTTGGDDGQSDTKVYTEMTVKAVDEKGEPVEGVEFYLQSTTEYAGVEDANLSFEKATGEDGKTVYKCGVEGNLEMSDDAYELLPVEESNYTLVDEAVVVTFNEDPVSIATVNDEPYTGEEIVVEVQAKDAGDESGDDQTEPGTEPGDDQTGEGDEPGTEPGDDQTGEGDEPGTTPEEPEYQTILNVKAVDEKGEAVEGVEFILQYPEYDGQMDLVFAKATDKDGKAAYECDNGNRPEMQNASYKLLPAEDSGYTTEEPAEVAFGADFEKDVTYIETVNKEAYTGEEIEIVVVKSEDAEEPEPEEPAEVQTALNIKVEDADGEPVEGVELYLRATVNEEYGDIALKEATDKDGKVVYECDNKSEMEEDFYEILPAEDSGYTCETPVEVVFGYDGEITYVVTVDGEAYTGEDVVVVVTPAEEPGEELPFEDVNAGTEEAEADWFYDYVAYVYENGLMTGLDETTFGPNEKLARAQMAVILYRLNGSPEVEYTDVFSDVPEGIWYADAVIWAQQTGVVTGYTDTGEFKPNQDISRQEITTMMYRYAEYKEYSLEGGTDFDEYPDAGMVAEFAKEAMSWAVGNGIISGKTDPVSLDPQGVTFRSECAAIMMRFVEAFGK